jgi:spore photoproduct lyase
VPQLWTPSRVLITPAAQEFAHGRAIAERAAILGADVIELKSNRLTGLVDPEASERQAYAQAKSTLAVVVSPPGQRKLSPIAPSADWAFHLAHGCPAHCQYCYLAGSLSGPPITRTYANLDEILEGLRPYAGQRTLKREDRDIGDTQFEVSCYTDPLALEHLTGALTASIRFFAGWEAETGLRFTTKFADVDPLLGVEHGGRTRVRFSVNAQAVAGRFEGGTASMKDRLTALRRLALAGYPVGLTIAPIMPVEDWPTAYGQLLDDAAAAVAGVPNLDLTAECITHRFTPGSKETLLEWYPRTKLEMDEEQRSRKFGKFGSVKYVYPREQMRELKDWFAGELTRRLPQAQLLYWT